MDSQSLFLTVNADTVYFLGFIDLIKGPRVMETPPMSLGVLDDMWFRWVTDFGLPGPDRGEGGRYLLRPPGYDGSLPDSGLDGVSRVRTTRVLILGRAFMENSAPKPTAELIKKTLKIYPYAPGGYGTSIATLLEGKVRPGRITPPPPTRFIEASGQAFSTIPASDFTFYEQINALVQQEPVDALDPEIMGQLAAIGIVKGKPFQPDARMKKILTDAAAVGSSAGRTLNSRTAFFFAYTGITSAIIMRLPAIGWRYRRTFPEAHHNYFDGAKTYTVTLPKDIPQARFWSLTIYDNQTRSMLDTPSVSRAPAATVSRHPPPRRTQTGRQRFTTARTNHREWHAATGFRQCPARAGS